MNSKKVQNVLLPTERIERSILLIRGQRVILDADLAALYGVPTKVLNQAVKRNRKRFPEDFMFRLYIPVQVDRRFRRNPITDSDSFRSPIPVIPITDSGHSDHRFRPNRSAALVE